MTLDQLKALEAAKPRNPRPILIRLNSEQLLDGAVLGAKRRINAIEAEFRDQNHKPELRSPEQLWWIDLNGAMGEIAFSVATGIAPPSTGEYRGKEQADFLDNIEVRTGSSHDRGLIIRKNDLDRKFVLVTGFPPTYRVWGWIWAGEARKRADWVANLGGGESCWRVPQDCLYDMSLLKLQEENF